MKKPILAIMILVPLNTSSLGRFSLSSKILSNALGNEFNRYLVFPTVKNLSRKAFYY